MRRQTCSLTILIISIFAVPLRSAEPDKLIETINAVDSEGKGNAEAAAAVRELTKSGSDVLPNILEAFGGANPLAMNWLRAAFETIAEREARTGKSLPGQKFEKFVRDRKHNPRARSLAFEWLKRVDKTAHARLVPGMIDDPSAELRREAVAFLIKRANFQKDTNAERATATFKKALIGATDDDQVKAIVKPLKELGVEIDLQRHFGLLTQWQIIGPFNNRDFVGFDAIYPPEKTLDLKATYQGQLGEVKWQPISTKDDYGIIDIGKSVKNYKGSCMYATTEFHSREAREIEFRLGTPNAWKMWVNGKMLFGRDEYHRGMSLDQYKVTGAVKAGKNSIVLKICQNEQTDSWAQRYQFQIRVCDASGVAVLSSADDRTSQLTDKPAR